jgi:type II secretory pathway component PulF
MKIYAYNAIDYSGQTIKGTVESETADSASREVSAKGLYLVSIRETAGLVTFFQKYLLKLRVGRADILEFTQNLSIMLKSGIPITTCLDDIIMSTTNNAFKPVLHEIQYKLECGSSVSAALAAHGTLFPEIVKTLVAVGEETGRLEESLHEASEHLQRSQNLSGTIKKALLYPAFALLATIGALFFWMVFVIPNLTVTLKSMGVKLPALTRALITISGFFQAHWVLMLFALLMVPPALFLMGKNSKFRYARDWAVIRLPVVKLIAFNRLMATFSEQFRMLSMADIAIERLFELMIPPLRNEYFTVHLLRAKENILNGNPISESLEQQKILPPMVISKLRIGQKTGTLDNQLDFLTKYYTKKLENATDNLGKIMEPLIIVTIGGLFAIIIMGLLLPIYDLVSKAGKM